MTYRNIPSSHRLSHRPIRWLATVLILVTLGACAEQRAITAPEVPTRPTSGDSVATPVPQRPDSQTPPPAQSAYTLVFDLWSAGAGGFEQPSLAHTTAQFSPDSPFSPPGDSLVRRVLDFAGVSDASISVDGQRAVFTCTNGHGTTLCTAAIDSAVRAEMPRAILSRDFSGLIADQPAISPDGLQVAFRGWQPGGSVGMVNPADIYLMNLDGTNLTRLTASVRGHTSFESPAWSPRPIDGAYRVAYAREHRNAEGYVVAHLESMRADGTDARALTIDAESSDREPAWSPDGLQIAFVRRSASAAGDLFVVQLDAEARPLTERALMSEDPHGMQRSPAWSPDGKRVAFVSAHETLGAGDRMFYNWQVYSVAAVGSDVQRHTGAPREHAHPVWLPRR